MKLQVDTVLTLILIAGVSWLLVVEGLAKQQFVWRRPRRLPRRSRKSGRRWQRTGRKGA